MNDSVESKLRGGIRHEQLYTIVCNSNISVTTRGYKQYNTDGHTIISDSNGKPNFMTKTENIKSISKTDMPLFS